MPKVRITETSPVVKVCVCSDATDPVVWERELGYIREFTSVDWEKTAAKNARVWKDTNGKLAGIEIDLVS